MIIKPSILNILFLAYLSTSAKVAALPLNLGSTYTDFASRITGVVEHGEHALTSRLPLFVTEGAKKLDELVHGSIDNVTHNGGRPLSLDRIAEVLDSSLRDISSLIAKHMDSDTPAIVDPVLHVAAASDGTTSATQPLLDVSSSELELAPALQQQRPKQQQQLGLTIPEAGIFFPSIAALDQPVPQSAGVMSTGFSFPSLPSSGSSAVPMLVAGNVGVAAALASLLVLAGIKGLRFHRRRVNSLANQDLERQAAATETEKIVAERDLIDLQNQIIQEVDPALLAAVAELASKGGKDLLDVVGKEEEEVPWPVLMRRMRSREPVLERNQDGSALDEKAEYPDPALPTISPSSSTTSYLSLPPSRPTSPEPQMHMVGAMPASPMPLTAPLPLTMPRPLATAAMATTTSLPPLALLIPTTHQWLVNFLVILFSWSALFPSTSSSVGGRRRRGGEFGVIA